MILYVYLPKAIVESPKLDQSEKMHLDKHINKLSNPSVNEMGPKENTLKTISETPSESIIVWLNLRLTSRLSVEKLNKLPMAHHMSHH